MQPTCFPWWFLFQGLVCSCKLSEDSNFCHCLKSITWSQCKAGGGEPNFTKAFSGWAFWSMCSKLERRWTTLLGVNMSFCVSEASVGYSKATGYFKRLLEKRKRGEKKHGNREAASFPLRSLSVEAVGYSNPFQAGKS